MKRLIVFASAIFCSVALMAQIHNDDVYELPEAFHESVRNEIRIPDVGKYKVLKSDLHIHTVFSDGKVWPDMRVAEAWKEGLDVIAITDHIEVRPRKDILKGDLNESYKIAAGAANSKGLIVIHGTEITRSKPFGHMNALFINDANLIDVKDQVAAVDEALRQGAFIQWNHPGWPDDKSTFYPIHEELISAGKIHGVEIVNYNEYYPLVIDWIEKYNLAPTANSDIHGLTSVDYAGRRPITLIFSESRTEAGVKEALFARRTVAMYDNLLFGTPELLKSLVLASLEINFTPDGSVLVTNLSDLPFKATYDGKFYDLPGAKTIRVGKITDENAVFQIENCYVGRDRKLTISAADFVR